MVAGHLYSKSPMMISTCILTYLTYNGRDLTRISFECDVLKECFTSFTAYYYRTAQLEYYSTCLYTTECAEMDRYYINSL